MTSSARLLLWTLSADERPDALPALLLKNVPDLVVLRGPVDERLRKDVELMLPGEALLFPAGAGDGLLLAVRGSFQYCGGTRDSWALELPGASPNTAGLVVTFPQVRDVGVVPLMALRMERPDTLSGWAERLDDAASLVASVAAAVGTRRLVIAGDMQAPNTYRSMTGRLLGPGLIEAHMPPSWPDRVGGLPFLPVFSLDRVLTGPAWRSPANWTLHAETRRAPLMLELSPAESVAGG